MENLINFNSTDNIIKIGNLAIETISVPGNVGTRTAIIKTSFKNIISVSLNSYITFGQQVDTAQSIHDDNNYILRNKSLRFYCNGNQTVNVCIIGII